MHVKPTGTRPKPKEYTPEEHAIKRARQALRAIQAHGVTMPNVARVNRAGSAGRTLTFALLGGPTRNAVLAMLPPEPEIA